MDSKRKKSIEINKRLKRLKEIIFEYQWNEKEGLIGFVDYYDCKELFSEVLKIDCEDRPVCIAGDDYLAIYHLENLISRFTLKDIHSIFPEIY